MLRLPDGLVHRLDPGPGDGPLLAVKALLDVAGVVTTAGSAALAGRAPAARDAEAVRRMRAAGARLVGVAATHELAFGTSGVNTWQGTPVNPLDPGLVPGGSSSGSAVAVAVGAAEVAIGSDTGGSVRIPAACCGVAGLKTTYGRVPVDGVVPLAPSLDTVGLLAADLAALSRGWQLLDPAAEPGQVPLRRVGRLRVGPPGPFEDPVDHALAGSGLDVVELALPYGAWEAAYAAAADVLLHEAWACHGALLESGAPVGEPVAGRLRAAREVPAEAAAAGRAHAASWRAVVAGLFAQAGAVVMPVLAEAVPAYSPRAASPRNRLTLPWNLAGVPAVTVPLGAPGAALQLVGPPGSEDLLLATAAAFG